MSPAGIFLNLFVVAAAFLWRTLLFRTTVIAIAGSAGSCAVGLLLETPDFRPAEPGSKR